MWDREKWETAAAALPLTPAGRLTALGLAWFADPRTGVSMPGRRVLAAQVELSPTSVWTALRRLEAAGAIRRCTGDAHQFSPTAYELVIPGGTG